MLNKLASRKLKKGAEHFSDRKQRIYSFLRTNPVGVLSSVTPNDDPHGAVIYYTVDKDFTVSFLTKKLTRKCDNLNHNSHVMLTVYEPNTQTTAQITGRALEVVDTNTINSVAKSIVAASIKSGVVGALPITKLDAGQYVAFNIIPLQVRMAVYSRPEPGEYTSMFDSIESYEIGEDT